MCIKASSTSKNRSAPIGAEFGCPMPFPFNNEYTILSAPVAKSEIPFPSSLGFHLGYQSSLILYFVLNPKSNSSSANFKK